MVITAANSTDDTIKASSFGRLKDLEVLKDSDWAVDVVNIFMSLTKALDIYDLTVSSTQTVGVEGGSVALRLVSGSVSYKSGDGPITPLDSSITGQLFGPVELTGNGVVTIEDMS